MKAIRGPAHPFENFRPESLLSSNSQTFSPTPLRRSYERARQLDATGQLRECIDILEHPEVISAEIVESLRLIDDAFMDGTLEPEVLKARTVDRIAEATEPEWIYEGRDLSVLGDSYSFTCLSSHVDPIPGDKLVAKESVDCLDFVGITCNASARPVLGTVQSESDSNAFSLLLRALAGFVELAPAIQLARMNRQYFKGALPEAPSFDLFLATWYYDENAKRTPVCEFTRDIAEVVKRVLAEQTQLACTLNDIVCLRMNPARFDGRMRFDWRV